MRICHIVYDCNPTCHRGGISKIVLELSRAQARAGNDVRVLTLEGGDCPSRENFDGVAIRRFSRSQPWRFGHSRELRRALLSSVDIDIIHTHNTFLPLNRTAARASRRLHVPLVISAHGALDPILLAGWSLKAVKKRLYVQSVERRVLRAASRIIVNSERERGWMRQLVVEPDVDVIPNGVPTSRRPESAAVADFKRRWGLDEAPALLYVGRLVPKKGIIDIISAVAAVRVEHPGAVLLIAGDRAQDPSYTARLDEAVRSRRMEGAVRWLGFLNEAEKPLAYASATLFLHASQSEGMPMAVLEAMGFGVPCLVTPGTMLGDLASVGAVSETPAERLGTVATALLRSSAEREGLRRRGAEIAAGRYSWDAVSDNVCAAYEQAAYRAAR